MPGAGFVHLSLEGVVRQMAESSAPIGTRMNDGACDRKAASGPAPWPTTSVPGGGSLYRLDGDGNVERILADLTISNGLGWSPDGATMYLVDSGRRVVHAFQFDAETGHDLEWRASDRVQRNEARPTA